MPVCMQMQLVTTWGIKVVGAIVVLILGRWIAGATRNSVSKALRRANTDESLIPFLASMAYYVVLTIVIISVLNLFGIQTTSLIAVVGAAGLAIGLALTLIHLISIPVTNTSVNPARSTSQALFVGDWALAQLWLFWVAPLIGGAIGGLAYRWLAREKG